MRFNRHVVKPTETETLTLTHSRADPRRWCDLTTFKVHRALAVYAGLSYLQTPFHPLPYVCTTH